MAMRKICRSLAKFRYTQMCHLGPFRFWAVAVLVLLIALPGWAGDIISAPHGFWVASRYERGKLYGPSSQNADWHITQWHAPRGELSAFSEGSAVSTNIRMQVQNGSYQIESDGSGLACGQEFGAFASANNPQNYKGYPTPYKGSPPLSEMRALKHRIGFTPLVLEVRNRNCRVTRGIMITAVVLRNTHEPSTFFYQLRLCRVGTNPKPFWWWKGDGMAAAEKAGRGLNFGFGDNLASYGLADPPILRRTVIEIDLLPRLLALLKDPTVRIDRNPSHWVVSGTYHGHGTYGNVRMVSRWDSFALYYE